VEAARHIICPHCGTTNRVPSERLAEAGGAECGKCHARLFSGHPVALDDEARFLKEIGKSDVPVLVDFWAAWCGPCMMMAPEFERAAATLEPRFRLAKVDTEKVQSVGARYGIRAIPTMILFHHGRELARQSGALQAAGIVRFAEAHLGEAAA
jgi:thioredoxin 2